MTGTAGRAIRIPRPVLNCSKAKGEEQKMEYL